MAAGKIEDLKRGSGAVFECRVKGDAGAFRSGLEARGCQCQSGEDGVIQIQMTGELDTRVLLQVARDRQVQIRHLVPLRHSLEEVFLQVIAEK